MKKGLFYFLGCQTCDQERIKHIYKVVAKTLYVTDLSEIRTEKIHCKYDGHTYMLISIPIGDAEMFRFLAYGCGADLTFKIHSGILKTIGSYSFFVQRLIFPNPSFHPIDVCMGFYLKKDYTNFCEYMSSFTYSDAFRTFMSIRMRIVQQIDDPNLVSDIFNYRSFHYKNNGMGTQQIEIADLLLVEYRIRKNIASQKDISVLCSVKDRLKSPTLKGYAQYLLGCYYQKDAEKQFLLFTQVDAPRFSSMVAFYIARKDYGRASFFAIQASQKFPTLENAKAFAHVFCKLNDRWRARVILREFLSLEDVKKYVLRRDETSLERICQACSKTGHVKTFLRCPNCQRTWYCSQKCLKGDEERHAVMHCRFCYACETWIPKQKRRQYCSGCYGYFYCGAACQLKHWNIGGHKDKCNKKK